MTIVRPRGLRAGFHAHLSNSGVPALVHAGDQHAPRTWLIPWHHHQAWELYLQLDGPETSWQIAEADHTVPPGGLLLVPPKVKHRLAKPASTPYHFYFASLAVDKLLHDETEMLAVWDTTIGCSIRDATDLIEPFEIFLREVATSQPFRVQGLRSSARQLLIETTRLLTPGPCEHSLTVHPAVDEARHILDSDLSADVTLTELANRVHLSPTYLSELFTTQLGQSPAQYRQRRRMRRAQVLLAETDLSITDIATDLGFSSPQHFATSFRQHHDTTPRQFRAFHRDSVTR